MSHTFKDMMRSTKNFTKGYTDLEIKVRNATSNDRKGPSGQAMADIATASRNHHQFVDIMIILDKRMNDKGKNWRHVFKALVVLDYLLLAGSEEVIQYARDNISYIKTLVQFQYINSQGADHGSSIRMKAKEIVQLLQEENGASLQRDRNHENLEAHIHEKFSKYYGMDLDGGESGSPELSDGKSYFSSDDNNSYSNIRSNSTEDEDLRRAIEASKLDAKNASQGRNKEASCNQRVRSEPVNSDDENNEELKLALAISKAEAEEEARRRNSQNISYIREGGQMEFVQQPHQVQYILAEPHHSQTAQMPQSFYSQQQPVYYKSNQYLQQGHQQPQQPQYDLITMLEGPAMTDPNQVYDPLAYGIPQYNLQPTSYSNYAEPSRNSSHSSLQTYPVSNQQVYQVPTDSYMPSTSMSSSGAISNPISYSHTPQFNGELGGSHIMNGSSGFDNQIYNPESTSISSSTYPNNASHFMNSKNQNAFQSREYTPNISNNHPVSSQYHNQNEPTDPFADLTAHYGSNSGNHSYPNSSRKSLQDPGSEFTSVKDKLHSVNTRDHGGVPGPSIPTAAVPTPLAFLKEDSSNNSISRTDYTYPHSLSQSASKYPNLRSTSTASWGNQSSSSFH